MKAKRTKKYRPKPVHQAGGLMALAQIGARGEAASCLRDDQQTDICTAQWLALENLARGEALEEHWCFIVSALNTGMALSETVIGEEYEQDFVKALDGLFRAKIRSKRTGNFRLDGEALRDVKAALATHDAQMKHVTKREFCDAMALVQKRIAEGNVYRDAAEM